MLLVGHQHSSIGKLDLVARAVNHHVGSGNNPRRLAVVVDQQIADSNVTHRGPATGRREGSIEGKRLAHTRTGRDDNHLTSVKTVGDLVEILESGGHTEGNSAAAGDGVDLVHRGLEELGEGYEVLGGSTLGDLEDLGLRAVDNLGHVLALGAGGAVLDE